jgi:hypothetical protein
MLSAFIIPPVAIERVLRLLRYRARLHAETDGELHPVWRVGVPCPSKVWNIVWKVVCKSSVKSDALMYRVLSARGTRCPLYVFEAKMMKASRRWLWLLYRVLFFKCNLMLRRTLHLRGAVCKSIDTAILFDPRLYYATRKDKWLNLEPIIGLKKLSFDEFHAFVDVALWSPLDADKVLRVSADGAVEQVEPEIEIMGEEKVQRSKRGGTERVPEAGD